MSKTPVSILQEYCAKNVIVPQYDLVINGVGTHDPFFKYKLTVKEIVTYGSGKSKKEAKHDAAKEALATLHLSHVNSILVNCSQPEILDPVEDITSPYHGALKENAIGELITICCNNKLPQPEYKLIGEEGPPHAKLFTFECHVAKIIVKAASRTKKQAKHLSAKLMLERLIVMLGDKLELCPPEASEEKISKEKDLDENAKLAFANLKTTKVNENFDLPIKDYHTVDLTPMFQDNPIPELQLSRYNTDDPSRWLEDPLKVLDEIFQHNEVGANFRELPSVLKDKRVFVCELDSCPAFVEFGVDHDSVEAQKKAAHKMLCLLKLFCGGLQA